ncbi:MAG: 30S ribosome-binding factor RbfA [Gammaproteobacteria bacterium]|nr:30S ribosome-binding factor RbfA [Gammaproteobacteria bacterium]
MSPSVRDQGRELRVADFIREELAQIIHTEMRDPRVGLVSITDTRVSRDLSYADIYVTSLDADDETKRAELIAVLNKAAGFLRTSIAQRHSMRTTPLLRFHHDDLVESGPRLEALIDKAVATDRSRANERNDPQDCDGGADGT